MFFSQGETALDAVTKAIKADEQEEGEDTEVVTGRKNVEMFLRQIKTTTSGPQRQPEMRRRNQILHEEDSAPNESEEERRKVLDIDESSNEDSEEFLPQRRTILARIINDDDFREGESTNNLEDTVMGSDPTFNRGIVGSCFTPHCQTTDRCPPQTCDSFNPEEALREEQSSGDGDSTYSSMDEDGVETFHVSDEDMHFTETAEPFPSLPFVGSNNAKAVPALIPETNRNAGSDWLVDDLAPRTFKRRRQSKLTATFQRTSTAGQRSRGKRNLSSGGQRNKTPRTHSRTMSSATQPRQSRLQVDREVITPRTNPGNVLSSRTTHQESVQHSFATANVTTSSLQTSCFSARPGPSSGGTSSVAGPSSGTPPMRVRVRVQGKTFLVPCPRLQNGEGKTIGWLAEQVNGILVGVVSLVI